MTETESILYSPTSVGALIRWLNSQCVDSALRYDNEAATRFAFHSSAVEAALVEYQGWLTAQNSKVQT